MYRLKLSKWIQKFSLNHGDTIKLFSFNRNLSFATRKKLHGTKSSKQEGRGMSVCFSLEIHAQTKQSSLVHGKKFGSNSTHVQTVFQNVLNWPKWYAQHISNFRGSSSSGLEDTFKISCFAYQKRLQALGIFGTRHVTQKQGVFPLSALHKLFSALCMFP